MNYSASTGYLSSDQLTLAHVNHLKIALSKEKNDNIRCQAVIDRLEQDIRIRDRELALEQRKIELYNIFAVGDGQPSILLHLLLTWLEEVCPLSSIDLKCCVRSGEIWSIIDSSSEIPLIFQDEEFDHLSEAAGTGHPMQLGRALASRTLSMLLGADSKKLTSEFTYIISTCSRCVWLVSDRERQINPSSQSMALENALGFFQENNVLLGVASQLMMASIIRSMELIESAAENLKYCLSMDLFSHFYADGRNSETLSRAAAGELWSSSMELVKRNWFYQSNYCNCEVFFISKSLQDDHYILFSSSKEIFRLADKRMSVTTMAMDQRKPIISSLSPQLEFHEIIDTGRKSAITDIIVLPLDCEIVRSQTPKPTDWSIDSTLVLVLRFQGNISKRDISCANAAANVLSGFLHTWLLQTKFLAVSLISGLKIMTSGEESLGAKSPTTGQDHDNQNIMSGSEFVDAFRSYVYGSVDKLFIGLEHGVVLRKMANMLECDWIFAVMPDTFGFPLNSSDEIEQISLSNSRIVIFDHEGVKKSVELSVLQGPLRDFLISGLFSPHTDCEDSVVVDCSIFHNADLKSQGLLDFVPTILDGGISCLQHILSVKVHLNSSQSQDNRFVFVGGRSWKPFDQKYIRKSLADISAIGSLGVEVRNMQRLFAVTDELQEHIAVLENERLLDNQLLEFSTKLSCIRAQSEIHHDQLLNSLEAKQIRVQFLSCIQSFVERSFVIKLSNNNGGTAGPLNRKDISIDGIDFHLVLAESIGSKAHASRLWELHRNGSWALTIANPSPYHKPSPVKQAIAAVRELGETRRAMTSTPKIAGTKKSGAKSVTESANITNVEGLKISIDDDTERLGSEISFDELISNIAFAQAHPIHRLVNGDCVIPFYLDKSGAMLRGNNSNETGVVQMFLHIVNPLGTKTTISYPRLEILQSFTSTLQSFADMWQREVFAMDEFIDAGDLNSASSTIIGENLQSGFISDNNQNSSTVPVPPRSINRAKNSSAALAIGSAHHEIAISNGMLGSEYYYHPDFISQLSLLLPHFIITPIKTLVMESKNVVGVFDILNDLRGIPARIANAVLSNTLSMVAEDIGRESDPVSCECFGTVHFLPQLGDALFHYFSDWRDVSRSTSNASFAFMYSLKSGDPTCPFVQFLILPRSEMLIVPSHIDRLIRTLNEALLPMTISLQSMPINFTAQSTSELVNSSVSSASRVLDSITRLPPNSAINGRDRLLTLIPETFHHPACNFKEHQVMRDLSAGIVREWVQRNSALLEGIGCVVRSAGFSLVEEALGQPVRHALSRTYGDPEVPGVVTTTRGMEIVLPTNISSTTQGSEYFSSYVPHSKIEDIITESENIVEDSGFYLEMKEYEIEFSDGIDTGSSIFNCNYYSFVRVIALFAIAKADDGIFPIAAGVFCICHRHAHVSPGVPESSVETQRGRLSVKSKPATMSRSPVNSFTSGQRPNSPNRSPARTSNSRSRLTKASGGSESPQKGIKSLEPVLVSRPEKIVIPTSSRSGVPSIVKTALIKFTRVVGGLLHQISLVSRGFGTLTAALRSELQFECQVRSDKQVCMNEIMSIIGAADQQCATLAACSTLEWDPASARTDDYILNAVRHSMKRWCSAEVQLVEKNAINADLHKLLCSLQTQLKSLTEFFNLVEYISNGQTSGNAAWPLSEATSCWSRQAKHVHFSQQVISRILDPSAALSLNSPLNNHLRRVLVSVAMNAQALERATELFCEIGSHEDWTMQLRQVALLISRIVDEKHLVIASDQKQKETLDVSDFAANILLSSRNFVVVWSLTENEDPQFLPVPSGIIDWQSVQLVLSTGRAAALDDDILESSAAPAVASDDPNPDSDSEIDSESDQSAPDMDLVSDISVETEKKSIRDTREPPVGREKAESKMAGRAISRRKMRRNVHSAPSLVKTYSSKDARNVLISPVIVKIVDDSHRSSKIEMVPVGAIQFCRPADIALVLDVQTKFTDWITAMGFALYSSSLQQSLISSSSVSKSRWTHGDGLLDLLRITTAADRDVLSKNVTSLVSINSQGFPLNQAALTVPAEEKTSAKSFSNYEASVRLGELLSGMLRVDACILLTSNAVEMIETKYPTGGDKWDHYAGVVNRWKDGFVSTEESNLFQILGSSLRSIPPHKLIVLPSILTPKTQVFGSHRNGARIAGNDSNNSLPVYIYSIPCNRLETPAVVANEIATNEIMGYAIIESRRPLLRHEVSYLQSVALILGNILSSDKLRTSLTKTNGLALKLSKSLQQQVFKARLHAFSGSLQSAVLKLTATDKQSILKTGQVTIKSVTQAEALAKQFQICFSDVVGFSSCAILQIDGKRILGLQDSMARSRLGTQFLFDASTDSMDIAALCLLLNKIILKEALPGTVQWSTIEQSPEGDLSNVLGWACVPIVAFKNRSTPQNTTGIQDAGVPSVGNQLLGSGNLVLQLGFSSADGWAAFKRSVMQAKSIPTRSSISGDQSNPLSMDDNESVGGETVANVLQRNDVNTDENGGDPSNTEDSELTLKVVTLTAARSLRHWIRNQKRILALQQRNHSYNVMSGFCNQISNGLAAAGHAIDLVSITSIDSLAAAFAFLFRRGGSPENTDIDGPLLGVRSIIRAIRLYWQHRSYDSNDGSLASLTEWRTVDLLDTKSTGKQTRFNIAGDFVGKMTPRSGSKQLRSVSSTPSAQSTGFNFTSPVTPGGVERQSARGEEISLPLEMFLQVGYWVATSAPTFLPHMANLLASNGGVLIGMFDPDNNEIFDGDDRRPSDYDLGTDLSGAGKTYLNKVWMSLNCDKQPTVLEIDLHPSLFSIEDLRGTGLSTFNFADSLGNTKFLYKQSPSSSLPAATWSNEIAGFHVVRSLFSKTVNQFTSTRENDAGHYSSEIANALSKKQIAVLAKCLADLAAEGGKVREVCQSIQNIINTMPGIHSSSLVISDTFDNTILFDKTNVYIKGLSSLETEQSQTPMPGDGQGVKRAPATSNASLTKAYFPEPTTPLPGPLSKVNRSSSTPGTTTARSKSFFCDDYSENISRTGDDIGALPAQTKKLFIDTGAGQVASSDVLPETEIAFDCFEISGRFSVCHIPRSQLEDELDCTFQTEIDLPEQIADAFCKLPAYLRAKIYATIVTGETYVNTVRSILQIVSRAVGRRVFEIMRERKHRKLLSENQDQISLQKTRISQTEASKADLISELDRSHKDAARLRALLVEEQEDCKKAVMRSKALEKKLTTVLTDLKDEHAKQEAALRKALNTAKEEKRQAVEKADRCTRDLSRAMEREKLAEKARRDSMKELEEVEKSLKRQGSTQEEVIRKLRQELQQSKQDMSQALSREVEKIGEGDARLRNVLTQLQKSIEEVNAGKAVTATLRKQVEESEAVLRSQRAQIIALEQELKVFKLEADGEKRVLEVKLRAAQDGVAQSAAILDTEQKRLSQKR